MDHTVKVSLRQLGDGRYPAESRNPRVSSLGETREDALLNLQEEVTLRLEYPYPGGFGGDFTAEALFVSFEVEETDSGPSNSKVNLAGPNMDALSLSNVLDDILGG